MSDQPRVTPPPIEPTPPLATGTEEIGKPKERIADTIQRRLNILVGMTVFLYLLLVGIMFLYVIPNQAKTNDALCTFRGDLQSRVIQTQEYLRDHPEGFPGVSAAQLQQSLAGQIRTVASLSVLDCPETPDIGSITPDQPTSTTPTTTPKN